MKHLSICTPEDSASVESYHQSLLQGIKDILVSLPKDIPEPDKPVAEWTLQEDMDFTVNGLKFGRALSEIYMQCVNLVGTIKRERLLLEHQVYWDDRHKRYFDLYCVAVSEMKFFEDRVKLLQRVMAQEEQKEAPFDA